MDVGFGTAADESAPTGAPSPTSMGLKPAAAGFSTRVAEKFAPKLTCTRLGCNIWQRKT